MPTYEYACGACKHRWEATQSIKEDPLTDCPKCGKPKAKRQISAGTGFILKGGGWYSDLYSSAKPKADSGSSEASTSAEKSESSTKTDTSKADTAKPEKSSKKKKSSSKSE